MAENNFENILNLINKIDIDKIMSMFKAVEMLKSGLNFSKASTENAKAETQKVNTQAAQKKPADSKPQSYINSLVRTDEFTI